MCRNVKLEGQFLSLMGQCRKNGVLAQGFGGPCCARILTSWFATKERGTYWGMWNIAHNLGGFGAPILAGTAARYYGWKWGEQHLLACSIGRNLYGN